MRIFDPRKTWEVIGVLSYTDENGNIDTITFQDFTVRGLHIKAAKQAAREKVIKLALKEGISKRSQKAIAISLTPK